MNQERKLKSYQDQWRNLSKSTRIMKRMTNESIEEELSSNQETKENKTEAVWTNKEIEKLQKVTSKCVNSDGTMNWNKVRRMMNNERTTVSYQMKYRTMELTIPSKKRRWSEEEVC